MATIAEMPQRVVRVQEVRAGPIPIMTVFGTRPEAVKMAPVVLGLRNSTDFTPIVVVSGQHREMLDQVTSLFGIVPDRDLNIMLPEQSLVDITTRALIGLYDLVGEIRPAMVLVQGDAHTTFIGALAAYYHRIPIGHVEAGLRTDNKYHPFPEEMNRRMTSSLADLHFAPTALAKRNLLREGIAEESIVVTGNTVIDALQTVRDLPQIAPVDGVPPLSGRRMLLVTTHRRENWGDPLRQIYLALVDLLEQFPDIEVVFSVHRNPVVRRQVWDILGRQSRAHLIEPPAYGPWIHLEQQAYLILTDSGGIQEEASALGRPVLVLRQTTERPEGIEAGTLRLVGTDRARIVEATRELLTDPVKYRRMAQARSPFGDGRATERIVQMLRYYYGRSSTRPREFDWRVP
jgi:UDP-N-acetylglucosamine 2-epimerase (non-hydrolysing)